MGRPCDSLAGYFISLFGNSKLQDITPCVLSPTWSNGRASTLSIAKRLDKFFFSEALCDSVGKYRSWNLSTGVLKHRAIILKVVFDREPMVYPFKFNHTWLVEENFCVFVKTMWEHISEETPAHLNP